MHKCRWLSQEFLIFLISYALKKPEKKRKLKLKQEMISNYSQFIAEMFRNSLKLSYTYRLKPKPEIFLKRHNLNVCIHEGKQERLAEQPLNK